MISPNQFKEFALPYIKEVCEKLLDMGYKHIWLHICGEHTSNLPYWAEIKVGNPGIISTPHEIDILKMAEYFPNDVIFGNLEPSLVAALTPDGVYEATRKIVEKGKTIKGGYIFSTGCELPPMAPIENVKAMSQAVEDYGWY